MEGKYILEYLYSILLIYNIYYSFAFLGRRYVKCDMEKKTALSSFSAMKESLLTREQKICQLEADLKIEREWRQRLQSTSEADKEALYKQKVQMTHLQTIGKVML